MARKSKTKPETVECAVAAECTTDTPPTNRWYSNFVSPQTVDTELEHLKTAGYMLTTTLLIVVFTVFIGPLSCLCFESRPLRYKVQGYVIRPIEHLLDRTFSRVFEYECSGDAVVHSDKLAAVFSNHLGFLDYFTLMNFSRKCGVENSNYFFVWKHCVRLPSLRVLYNMWRKQSNWRVPAISLAETFSTVLESPWVNEGGKWVILFPEVSPWSATTMLEDRAECADNGCPKLSNLLYPRFNAFVQTVTFLRDFPLAEIYDVSILYSDKSGKVRVPGWQDLLFSNKDWKIHLSIKQHLASSLPHKEKHLVKWLEMQWYRKDLALATMRDSIQGRE